MIITKSTPFTPEEIKKLQEAHETYIKTVIDLNKSNCSAGAQWHYELEQALLAQDSSQKDLWRGGVDLETNTIDYNSLINIRPGDNNSSNEIQDPQLRGKFEKLSKYFFKKIYDK